MAEYFHNEFLKEATAHDTAIIKEGEDEGRNLESVCSFM